MKLIIPQGAEKKDENKLKNISIQHLLLYAEHPSVFGQSSQKRQPVFMWITM